MNSAEIREALAWFDAEMATSKTEQFTVQLLAPIVAAARERLADLEAQDRGVAVVVREEDFLCPKCGGVANSCFIDERRDGTPAIRTACARRDNHELVIELADIPLAASQGSG